MIELHGQAAWDRALAEQGAIDDAGGPVEQVQRSEEEIAALTDEAIATAPLIGGGLAASMALLGIILSLARGISPSDDPRPLIVGAAGIVLALVFEAAFISPLAS